MLYTVSDLSREYSGSLRLLAGSDGLAHAISGVGILDYELMPGLKNKYQRVNFRADEIVLSTFLYAQDDPYLITEAIKYLVAKGTSGLVIKNALHLAIPEQALRYANVRHYPVFLVTSESLFFDQLIYGVNRHIEDLSTIDFAQRAIDALRAESSPEALVKRTRSINPSFLDEAVTLFRSFEEALAPQTFLALEKLYAKSELANCHNLFATYDGGLMLVATADPETSLDAHRIERALTALLETCDFSLKPAGIGISEVLFGEDAVARAVDQAICAEQVSKTREGDVVSYSSLGILKAVMPFAQTPEMTSFADAILSPIREHDAEHAGQLEETLYTFAGNGQHIERTAQALQQHPNTVRYRLDKIAALTGLSYKDGAQATQLALACAVEQARMLQR